MAQRSKIMTVAGPVLVVVGVVALMASAARVPIAHKLPQATTSVSAGDDSIVQKVDRLFADRWQAAEIEPAELADDLTLLRRLSLVLLGTTPSLEEVCLFETDHEPNRIERWTERMLADRRFADYFTRRFARVFVGSLDGQFVIFRRDRFWAWLSDQLHTNQPYDQIVRQMIAERGLWTDKPEVNFITAAVSDEFLDHNKLAGRTVRAFLGQRIDCAQCHNHPFANWKQGDFEGLAAYFGQISRSPIGIEDNMRESYKVKDRITLQDRVVEPGVPFHSEWLPSDGRLREQLAAWVTHPENRRFERAIVNRIWGLMYGKSWMPQVDDIPDPKESGRDPTDLLDVLGADFREHGCDLKRLIATVAATRVFRSSSLHPAFDTGIGEEAVDENWAAFPITRMRPEQLIGAMVQASSVKTVDQDSHWTIRFLRFFRELEFVKEYGDLGDDELTERPGTIPQQLLKMNSNFADEWTKGTIFSAAGRISAMAPTDDACVDSCFLACLTRHATDEEKSVMGKPLEKLKGEQRSRVVEDIYWSLFNSPEFSWEH